MRALMKVGFGLLVLAFVLIGLSYSMLRAQAPASRQPEGRMVASETRTVDARRHRDRPERADRPDPAPGRRAVADGARRTAPAGQRRHHAGRRHAAHRHHGHAAAPPPSARRSTLVLPSIETSRVRGSGDSTVNGFSGDASKCNCTARATSSSTAASRQVNAGVHGSGETGNERRHQRQGRGRRWSAPAR